MTIRAALARGFTLIEMAIVLVVIGLALSGGLVAVAPVIQSSKTTETISKLDRIEQALVLYVIRNGCLPCPATPGTNTLTGTDPGKSILGGAGYTSGCTGTTDCDIRSGGTTKQGIVPWVTLGLSEADVIDGFGARIDYVIGTGLSEDNGMVRTPPSTYPSGDLIVNDRTGTNEQTGGSGNRAAYVLISHGINRAYGYLAQTGTGPIADPHGSGDAEVDNSNGSPFRMGDALLINGTTYFDDIVRFRTAPILIQLCGSNACGNPA